MATASIKRNVVISGNKSGKRFVDALEAACKNPRKPSGTNTKTLQKGEISEIFKVSK